MWIYWNCIKSAHRGYFTCNAPADSSVHGRKFFLIFSLLCFCQLPIFACECPVELIPLHVRKIGEFFIMKILLAQISIIFFLFGRTQPFIRPLGPVFPCIRVLYNYPESLMVK